MTENQASLGEQALSKAAEVGLSTQLNEVEDLNVDIRTNPIKLMQGELDSVAIEGRGMVMREDLRMEALQLDMGRVAINPLSAAFGKIELTRPTDATAQVVLTEADLNRALSSGYLHDKLQNLEMTVNGEPTTIDVQQAEIFLPGEGKLTFDAEIYTHQTGETQQVRFTSLLRMSADGQNLALDELEYEGQSLSLDLINAFLAKITALMDLRNFHVEGMSLAMRTLEIGVGKMTIQADAHVEQLPS